jgi:hypothetical protein
MIDNRTQVFDVAMKNARTIEACVDRLAMMGADHELKLIARRLSRLTFRAAPSEEALRAPRAAHGWPLSLRKLGSVRALSSEHYPTLAHSPPAGTEHRAAEQRDEVATVQLVELHSIPASQGRAGGSFASTARAASATDSTRRLYVVNRRRAASSVRSTRPS